MSDLRKKAAAIQSDLGLSNDEIKMMLYESEIKIHEIRSSIAKAQVELEKLKKEEAAEKEIQEWLRLVQSVNKDTLVSITEDMCSKLSIRSREIKYTPARKNIKDIF